MRDAPGEADGEAASGRRHGRPLEVMPRHVVPGFLESDRPMSDSGVLGMNGIVRQDSFCRLSVPDPV
jgi:hypothetical protein